MFQTKKPVMSKLAACRQSARRAVLSESGGFGSSRLTAIWVSDAADGSEVPELYASKPWIWFGRPQGDMGGYRSQWNGHTTGFSYWISAVVRYQCARIESAN
jgi:hypothetical protein